MDLSIQTLCHQAEGHWGACWGGQVYVCPRYEEMSTWQVQLEQELGDGGQTAMQRVRMSPCAYGVGGQ